MISQTAEYALRAIVFLADHEGESHTSDAISSVTKVPAGYLAKILQGLARAGMINSQRGPYGGFSLAIDQDELTVFDVIQVVDPIHRIDSCPLRLRTHGSTLCPLHRLLDDVLGTMEKRLREVTVGSLLNDGNSDGEVVPLCEFPRHAKPNAAKANRRNAETK